MKRAVYLFAIILAEAWGGCGAQGIPLTTLNQIKALDNTDAGKQLPVSFKATVVYYRAKAAILFVQDGKAAIYVYYPTELKLAPGDRVLVKGKTQKSFTPIVVSDSITFLNHGALPKPERASFDQMIRAETDCRLVTVRATIRAVDGMAHPESPPDDAGLQLLMDGGYFRAEVDGADAGAFQGLVDAEVELTGVASQKFDSKMHQTGVLLMVQSASDIKVIKRAESSPWSLPVTPMDRVIKASHINDSTQRVRVHGTITYYEPGSAVVLQDGIRSIWINTPTTEALRIGDAADATGFPDNHDGFLSLEHGTIRDTLTPAPVAPLAAAWDDLSPKGYSSPGHHDDLISIEGRVVTEVREASQDEMVLRASSGKLFSAIFRHPNDQRTAIKEVATDSNVRVIGICVLENSDPFMVQVPFRILLRNNDDITVIARPSPINTRNLLIALGLLLLVVFAVIARSWLIERNVRRQATTMAEIERRRSRILEDINGSLPLAEIIEEIAVMVSFTMSGAPCWCEITDGETLGTCPKEPQGLRIIRAEISARSGLALGTLYAEVNPKKSQIGSEIEALRTGSRLATLAIETRQLYSDLRRSSEYDLLTNIPNRFAMERFIDVKIEEARISGGVLGLIYIDLDKFKPINDAYGHHVGDLYLQEVALRMSRQLLGGDMIARLGGDEFAALVSLQHGRGDLDKILARLESCFNEPFSVERILLHGEASIGFALYPEDGDTRDRLLSAADAAMYEVKNGKRNFEEDSSSAQFKGDAGLEAGMEAASPRL